MRERAKAHFISKRASLYKNTGESCGFLPLETRLPPRAISILVGFGSGIKGCSGTTVAAESSSFAASVMGGS